MQTKNYFIRYIIELNRPFSIAMLLEANFHKPDMPPVTCKLLQSYAVTHPVNLVGHSSLISDFEVE